MKPNFNLPAEFTSAQYEHTIAALQGKLAATEGILAQVNQENENLRVAFANERAARIKTALDSAVTSGRITPLQRPDWERRLSNQTEFANEFESLGRVSGHLKTVSLLQNAGARKVEIANSAQRKNTVQDLVQAEIESAKCDYDTAFARIQRKYPALFEMMKQPKVGK